MQEVFTKVRPAVSLTKLVPVITAVPYTAGDSVGDKQSISVSAGQIHSLTIFDNANQKAAFDILIFDADPSAATTTDNAPFVWSTDGPKLIARIAVATGDYVTVASKAIAQKSGLDLLLQSSGTLYAVAVTSGTPTYAVGDLQFIWGTA